MAFYIKIDKIEEDETRALYAFSPSDGLLGRLELLKINGEVRVIQEIPGVGDNRYSARAARALFLHWKKGEYPDETCWAS